MALDNVTDSQIQPLNLFGLLNSTNLDMTKNPCLNQKIIQAYGEIGRAHV